VQLIYFNSPLWQHNRDLVAAMRSSVAGGMELGGGRAKLYCSAEDVREGGAGLRVGAALQALSSGMEELTGGSSGDQRCWKYWQPDGVFQTETHPLDSEKFRV